MEAQEILKQLLHIELTSNAQKLKFVDIEGNVKIDDETLVDAISALNELSLKTDELSRKQLIAISALLWTYRKEEWSGLKSYLILFLSRAGFGPSSIMIDSDYSHKARQFSFGDSLLNQFAVTVAQVKNEISIDGSIFLLTDFQKDIWEAIESNSLIGISAPTSAGKSFLILLKAIDLIQKKDGVVVYVVPTLSLVSQVVSDFRSQLDAYKLTDYSLETTFNASSISQKAIYVLTQERAIAAFSQAENPFGDIRLLVIDEIQNVEKVATADDQRSKVLYDLMIELRNNSQVDHTIISGPRIVNIDQLGAKIFGIESVKKETNSSPVLNLTYSVSKKKSSYFLNVYSDLIDEQMSIEITNDSFIQGYGKVMYTDSYLDYLSDFLHGFGEDESNLIFSPTSLQCGPIATHLSESSSLSDSTYLSELSGFISDTVHPQFTLSETIRKGIAYHHGKLPFHVRLLVEDGIRRKEIKTIICTTTLLQGVNLPVQNIIIRNPNLYTRRKKDSIKLSNYEIANLRGRAGRLLKDFVGRTYILDEKSFKETSTKQLDLFKDSAKELEVGYGKKYQVHKKEIRKDLVNEVGKTNENQDYSFLTTYLRQTVMRHGLNSQVFLGRVGIVLSDSEMNEIIDSLRNLEVSREICLKNRYWDPIDLNRLYEKRNSFQLPTSAAELGLSYRLKALLQALKDDFQIYYFKYFGVKNTFRKDGSEVDRLLQFCILTEKWLKETTLKDIFSDRYYDVSSKIDDTISFIQKEITYGLPLLLKPIYDIQTPEGMFTRFIELGAYKPLTRKLIELGIPRETAIFLSKNFDIKDFEDREKLINQLRVIRTGLPYWYKVQLSSI